MMIREQLDDELQESKRRVSRDVTGRMAEPMNEMFEAVKTLRNELQGLQRTTQRGDGAWLG